MKIHVVHRMVPTESSIRTYVCANENTIQDTIQQTRYKTTQSLNV